MKVLFSYAKEGETQAISNENTLSENCSATKKKNEKRCSRIIKNFDKHLTEF